MSSDGSAKITSRMSLSEKVTEELRNDVIAGRYKPGERLTELRLSADYGVSRVPVREALRTLESEGFVVVTSYTDRVVAEMTREDTLDLYAIREAVELRAVERAAGNGDSAGRHALISLLAEGMHCIAEDDSAGLMQLNARFHQAVASASGSVLLMSMYRQVEAKIRWTSISWGDARWRESWLEHAAIVQAIITGEVEQAADLMSTHLRALSAQASNRDAD